MAMASPEDKRKLIVDLLMSASDGDPVLKGATFDASVLYGLPKPSEVFTEEDNYWLRDEIFVWHSVDPSMGVYVHTHGQAHANNLYLACRYALEGKDDASIRAMKRAFDQVEYYTNNGMVEGNTYFAYLMDIAWTICISRRVPDVIIKPAFAGPDAEPTMVAASGRYRDCDTDIPGVFIAPFADSKTEVLGVTGSGYEVDYRRTPIKTWQGVRQAMAQKFGWDMPPGPECFPNSTYHKDRCITLLDNFTRVASMIGAKTSALDGRCNIHVRPFQPPEAPKKSVYAVPIDNGDAAYIKDYFSFNGVQIKPRDWHEKWFGGENPQGNDAYLSEQVDALKVGATWAKYCEEAALASISYDKPRANHFVSMAQRTVRVYKRLFDNHYGGYQGAVIGCLLNIHFSNMLPDNMTRFDKAGADESESSFRVFNLLKYHNGQKGIGPKGSMYGNPPMAGQPDSRVWTPVVPMTETRSGIVSDFCNRNFSLESDKQANIDIAADYMTGELVNDVNTLVELPHFYTSHVISHIMASVAEVGFYTLQKAAYPVYEVGKKVTGTIEQASYHLKLARELFDFYVSRGLITDEEYESASSPDVVISGDAEQITGFIEEAQNYIDMQEIPYLYDMDTKAFERGEQLLSEVEAKGEDYAKERSQEFEIVMEDAKAGVFGDVVQPGKATAFVRQASEMQDVLVEAIDRYGKDTAKAIDKVAKSQARRDEVKERLLKAGVSTERLREIEDESLKKVYGLAGSFNYNPFDGLKKVSKVYRPKRKRQNGLGQSGGSRPRIYGVRARIKAGARISVENATDEIMGNLKVVYPFGSEQVPPPVIKIPSRQSPLASALRGTVVGPNIAQQAGPAIEQTAQNIGSSAFGYGAILSNQDSGMRGTPNAIALAHGLGMKRVQSAAQPYTGGYEIEIYGLGFDFGEDLKKGWRSFEKATKRIGNQIGKWFYRLVRDFNRAMSAVGFAASLLAVFVVLFFPPLAAVAAQMLTTIATGVLIVSTAVEGLLAEAQNREFDWGRELTYAALGTAGSLAISRTKPTFMGARLAAFFSSGAEVVAYTSVAATNIASTYFLYKNATYGGGPAAKQIRRFQKQARGEFQRFVIKNHNTIIKVLKITNFIVQTVCRILCIILSYVPIVGEFFAVGIAGFAAVFNAVIMAMIAAIEITFLEIQSDRVIDDARRQLAEAEIMAAALDEQTALMEEIYQLLEDKNAKIKELTDKAIKERNRIRNKLLGKDRLNLPLAAAFSAAATAPFFIPATEKHKAVRFLYFLGMNAASAALVFKKRELTPEFNAFMECKKTFPEAGCLQIHVDKYMSQFEAELKDIPVLLKKAEDIVAASTELLIKSNMPLEQISRILEGWKRDVAFTKIAVADSGKTFTNVYANYRLEEDYDEIQEYKKKLSETFYKIILAERACLVEEELQGKRAALPGIDQEDCEPQEIEQLYSELDYLAAKISGIQEDTASILETSAALEGLAWSVGTAAADGNVSSGEIFALTRQAANLPFIKDSLGEDYAYLEISLAALRTLQTGKGWDQVAVPTVALILKDSGLDPQERALILAGTRAAFQFAEAYAKDNGFVLPSMRSEWSFDADIAASNKHAEAAEDLRRKIPLTTDPETREKMEEKALQHINASSELKSQVMYDDIVGSGSNFVSALAPMGSRPGSLGYARHEEKTRIEDIKKLLYAYGFASESEKPKIIRTINILMEGCDVQSLLPHLRFVVVK